MVETSELTAILVACVKNREEEMKRRMKYEG